MTPIPCHSHNDYQQQVPLYDALNAGCMSLEADIWLQDNDLVIGHEQDTPDPLRTLQSLYLDPLVSSFGDRNPSLDLAAASTDHPEGILKATSPLDALNLLTRFNGIRMVQGPITVVVSGTTEFFKTIVTTTDRTVFFDAPLDHLWDDNAPSNTKGYNQNNSFYACTSFARSIGQPSLIGGLSNEQVNAMKAQIEEAHQRGLKVWYWDTPGERMYIGCNTLTQGCLKLET
ncbi:MAG: hypothetical protein Q9207_004651 [Kuettlingeria erythrocarpa]